MALTGFAAVLYYGIFASITGGYLPFRAKNWWLIVFHLYLFLSFIILPLVIYLVDVRHWAGWLVYSLLTLGTFLILKIINFRLHRALGVDPVAEEEEQQEEEEEEEEGEKEEGGGEKEGKDEDEEGKETERKELGLDGELVQDVRSKAMEAGFLLPGQASVFEKEVLASQETQLDESLQRHRDSASTLGQSSTHHSSEDATAEMLQLSASMSEGGKTAESAVVAVEMENEREEEGEGEGVEDTTLLNSSGSTVQAVEGDKGMGREEEEEEEEESEGEYRTPMVSLVPGTGMDSGLMPIEEESVMSQAKDEKVPTVSLSQPEPSDVQPALPHSVEWLQQSNSSIGLMSPMHHSSTSAIQSSSNIHTYITALTGLTQSGGGGSAQGTLEVRPPGLQRSVSLPLNNERGHSRRDRARVEIRHGRRTVRGGYSLERERGQVGEGEVRREEDVDGEGVTGRTEQLASSQPPVPLLLVDSSERDAAFPQARHRRRHAVHGRQHQPFSQEVAHHTYPPAVSGPRALSLGAVSSATTSASVARATARQILDEEVEEKVEEQDEEEEEEEEEEDNPLTESVKHKLLEHGHLSLLDVVEKMPSTLHESIVTEAVPQTCLENISQRVQELQHGHLARTNADSTGGAIHWFEVGGEWNFYVFRPDEDEEEESDPLPESDLFMDRFQQEMLNRYGLDLGNLYPPSTPPHPPPRPPRGTGEGEGEESLPPTYWILPGVKKTSVELKFKRRQLEEFMDRNVSVVEVVLTVVLAVLVCVVAAVLLNIGFYRDIWVFWFCFVVGTAHFSLVKSVQGDPASPIPGQNHITAASRAFYFILIGFIALCIDLALEHTDVFSPLCVYGFNVNSRSILIFVRDGLLIFILFFPVLFAWGLMPQADTFVIYFLEQLDMHIFGGTAATGLICAFHALARSVLATALLWPLGYAAFYTLESKVDSNGNKVELNCSFVDTDPNDPGGQCEFHDRVALSFYNAAILVVSFALSRNTSNHQHIWDLVVRVCRSCKARLGKTKEPVRGQPDAITDPLDEIYFQTLRKRLLADLVVGLLIFVAVTALNVTTVFCRSMIPAYVLYGLTCCVGVFNHYIIPHVRKEMPWLCCSEPIMKASEWDSYEVSESPRVTPVEWFLQVSLFLEKNVLYPLSFLFALNLSALHYKARFGDYGAALVLSIAGMKLFRSSFTELSRQHIIFIFTLFFFNYDYRHLSEGLPLDYLIIAILFNKFYDLLLKVYFIYIYIAPWQISWSSPGHIIVQPLLIPHTPNIFLQTLVAAIVGCPINPVVASTFFTLSYARPVKYWEKDYNTKRSDSSNTRLDSQLEGNLRNPNPDRLDSLFYEHLTWVLQKSLCGDLTLGRWGKVTAGDFFILTSDRLNALVHIIEIGNGFVTFQLRGLEFRGTYCHQREVEAITESATDDEGCCCFEPGHLPYMLSCNKAFSARWMAWEVVSTCYTIHGYSIAENQAHLVFNSFDYKRSYITYYCKCIIYHLVKFPRLQSLLTNERIREDLQDLHEASYVDRDLLFDETRNCDYSHTSGGVSRERFINHHHPFIRVCVQQQSLEVDDGADSFLVTLCFAFTLLGRRMFFQHAQSGSGRRGDNFMNGLYRMFLGDARPHHPGDEWVFQDVDSIQEIIIPAARIALKVHQDNFTFSEEYESALGVYEAIQDVEENHIVTHENDREWRNAVVMNKPSLLALRYQRTEDSYIYPYKLIRLTSKFIKFRVVKVNRECVRGLWTSQQQELIFLRNSDSERGSIQNHKPTLRNMINSSMDLPIGYPIYVSPLHTSYLDRHDSYNSTLFGKITDPLRLIHGAKVVKKLCDTCVKHYQGSRSQATIKSTHQSSSDSAEAEGGLAGREGGTAVQRSGSVDSLTGMQYGEEREGEEGKATQSYKDPFPESDSDSDEQLWRPMWVSKTVVITDESEIFDSFNPSWLKWPDNELAQKASKSHWKSWQPQKGMEGEVVHEWRPFHIEAVKRSHIDKVILLVKMADDCYVLIREHGVKEV